jgi:hypothetical protein
MMRAVAVRVAVSAATAIFVTKSLGKNVVISLVAAVNIAPSAIFNRIVAVTTATSVAFTKGISKLVGSIVSTVVSWIRVVTSTGFGGKADFKWQAPVVDFSLVEEASLAANVWLAATTCIDLMSPEVLALISQEGDVDGRFAPDADGEFGVDNSTDACCQFKWGLTDAEVRSG